MNWDGPGPKCNAVRVERGMPTRNCNNIVRTFADSSNIVLRLTPNDVRTMAWAASRLLLTAETRV
jgi:hypothetical protein